jgi:hypothetical protein
MVDAEPAERVARLQAAGAAADDYDPVLAWWEGTFVR